MGNFQLLSREQEVEIAKRIEAGEQEVEEEVLKSPVTLDFLIDLGERIEAGEADLRDIFEESDEPADPDEERGPEANEKLIKKLHDSTRKLKELRAKLEELEEELRVRPGPRRKPKLERHYARLRERVKAAFTTMGLSRHVREAVISEMRHQLDQFRHAHQIVEHYEDATGRSKIRLFCYAWCVEERSGTVGSVCASEATEGRLLANSGLPVSAGDEIQSLTEAAKEVGNAKPQTVSVAGALLGDGAFGAPRGMPRTTHASSRAAPRIARRQGCLAYRTGNDRFPHALAQKLSGHCRPSSLTLFRSRAGGSKSS
jgi:hypothetical protein